MKKKIFLLASVAMGVALVGGTFASWAVTDNADPFSIKVSTGSVSTDEAEYVTLEWGSSQSMSNVSNLALNTIRKAGVLDLRANTASNNAPNGNLSLAKAGGSHLLAGLDVKVYQGDLTATGGVIEEATVNAATEVIFDGTGKANITVSKNVANLFTVAVSLKSSVDAAALDEMTDEQVTLTFDWGKGTDVLEAITLYAYNFGEYTPYVYAWNGTSQNASFPGVEMTPVTGAAGYFTAQVNASFTKVIFTSEHEEKKSGDIVVAESFTGGKNLFSFDSDVATLHGTIGTFDPTAVKVPEYYVVGSFTSPAWTVDPANLTATKMTHVDATLENPEHYTLSGLTLAANAEVKIWGGITGTTTYYGNSEPWPNCGFTVDTDGNVVVTNAGTYTVNFYINADNGNFITLESSDYYIIGSFTGASPEYWALDANYKLAKVDEGHFQLTGVALTATSEFKVKHVLGQYLTNSETWTDCGFALTEGDNNIKPLAAGTYTIDFYLTPVTAGHYITLTQTA